MMCQITRKALASYLYSVYYLTEELFNITHVQVKNFTRGLQTHTDVLRELHPQLRINFGKELRGMLDIKQNERLSIENHSL